MTNRVPATFYFHVNVKRDNDIYDEGALTLECRSFVPGGVPLPQLEYRYNDVMLQTQSIRWLPVEGRYEVRFHSLQPRAADFPDFCRELVGDWQVQIDVKASVNEVRELADASSWLAAVKVGDHYAALNWYQLEYLLAGLRDEVEIIRPAQVAPPWA